MPAFFQYPNRMNINDSLYVEIAVRNYYHALIIYDQIKQAKYEIRGKELFELEKDIIVTIVFSAMATESYLNSYIAGCIGDENYYGYYEKLNWIEKLNLIVQFIYGQSFDKNIPCYTFIKQLEKKRNKLLHSKSKQMKATGATSLEEIDEWEASQEYQENFYKHDKEEIETIMKEGLNSLKAVKELASYIDKTDAKANAIISLFWPQIHGENDEKEIAKTIVYPKLGIKVTTFY